MKCKNCNLCLNIVRLDEPEKSYIYFFCELCYRTYTHSNGQIFLVEDEIIKTKVKGMYLERIKMRKEK
jgi:hypothetical protein